MQFDPIRQKWLPVLYGSRKFSPAESKWFTTEQECRAVQTALKKNRQYLIGKKFKLVTDHKPLTTIMTKRELPAKVERMVYTMQEFPGMEIVHRPGQKIPGVDFLSRHPIGDSESDFEDDCREHIIDTITDTNQVPTHDDYRLYQHNDPYISDIIRRLSDGSLNSNTFYLRNNLLYRLRYGRLVLELPDNLVNNILFIHHDIPLSGHSAFERTYDRIRERFFFRDMRKRVYDYCKSCHDCQINKRPHGFKYGLMTIPKTYSIGEKWFLDTCGPFPISDLGNRHIIIAMESYTRWVVADASPDTTADSIQTFLTKIITTYGCFRYLITDNAKAFHSLTMKSLSERVGYKHIFTTPYHPQSNSVERVNSSLVGMLSMYTSSSQDDWDMQLGACVFAINTLTHRSIRTTPYFLMFQREPLLPGDIPNNESATVRKNRWSTACKLAEKQTKLVQSYNKSYYDKRRQAREFSVGDSVLVRQLASKPGKKTKLLPKYNGPFVITRKLSPITYEVQYSNNKSDILHIQMLKKFRPRLSSPTFRFIEQPRAAVQMNDQPTEAESSDGTPVITTQPTPRPPPRHRYPTRYSLRTAVSVIICLYFLLFSCNAFDTIDQTLWKVSDRRVYNEVIPFNFQIDFKSPCKVFELHAENPAPELIEWCKLAFFQDFVTEFENHCQTTNSSPRPKRAFPILIVAAVGLGITALGTGTGILIYELTKLDYKRLESELNSIREKVRLGIDAEEHIIKALKLGGIEMNKTQLFIDYKAKNIKSDIALATIIAHELAVLSRTLSETSKERGIFKLTDDLLRIMNTTLPCGNNCPTEMTTVIYCHIDSKDGKLNFGVLARKPMNKILVLQSDPFVLFNTSGAKYCHTNYIGPEFLLFDEQSKCSLPVPDYEKLSFIAYSKPSIVCDRSAFENWQNLTETTCSIEHTFKLIQFKHGKRFNFIYCYYQNVTVNGRTHMCPPVPFKLSHHSNFTIQGFHVSQMTKILNFRPMEDYLLSEITNKFLSHAINPLNDSFSDYYREIGQIHIPTLERIEKHSYLSLWITLGMSVSFVSIALLYVSVRLHCVRRRNSAFRGLRHDIALETARQLAQAVEFTVPEHLRAIDETD